MGQEGDAHGAPVSQDGERERVEGIYAGYASDPGRQRAWSAENAGNRAIRAELVDAVLPWLPAVGVLLDVGCGTGWWLAELAARGVPVERLAGVELQEVRAVAARKRVGGADVRVADARALPFAPDGAVAVVTLFTTLSSMGDDAGRRAALREARRVVAPGGVVVVWEPRVPTGNRATARVPLRLLREELGPDLDARSLTLLPPLARRVSPSAYQGLARVPALRTHRLVVGRMG